MGIRRRLRRPRRPHVAGRPRRRLPNSIGAPNGQHGVPTLLLQKSPETSVHIARTAHASSRAPSAQNALAPSGSYALPAHVASDFGSRSVYLVLRESGPRLAVGNVGLLQAREKVR